MPPRAAVAEHNANAQMRMAEMLMPARRAASGLPPVAYMYRPNFVRWSTSVQAAHSTRTIGITQGIPVTDRSELPRLTEQMITTAAPKIAISPTLIATRLSGGTVRPLRRLAVSRSHWDAAAATTTTTRIIQATTGGMSPWTIS